MYYNYCSILASEKSGRRGEGQPQSFRKKFVKGFLFVTFLIVVIWFPLAYFSTFNTSLQCNAPTKVTLQVAVEAFDPLFTMDVLTTDSNSLSQLQYDTIVGCDRYNTTPRRKYVIPPQSSSLFFLYSTHYLSLLNLFRFLSLLTHKTPSSNGIAPALFCVLSSRMTSRWYNLVRTRKPSGPSLHLRETALSIILISPMVSLLTFRSCLSDCGTLR